MSHTFMQKPPKNLFFTGKGGVGKTTTSAATAIALADNGKRVLLVSTDPASNLEEVLGLTLSAEPAQVPGVPGLFALTLHERNMKALAKMPPALTLLPRMEPPLRGAEPIGISALRGPQSANETSSCSGGNQQGGHVVASLTRSLR